MRRPLALALAAALLHAAAYAQAASPPLVVDVAVYDQSGHPLHRLNLQNFRLTDNRAPQTPTRLEQHTPPPPPPPPPHPISHPGRLVKGAGLFMYAYCSSSLLSIETILK